MQTFPLRTTILLVLVHSFAVVVAKEVCYGKYGCFDNKPPFHRSRLYNFLPTPPKTMKTEYFLFTRADRIGFDSLDDSNANQLKNSKYDGSKRTILIIHGWTGKPLESKWAREIKDQMLIKEDVNVVIVGWKKGASSLFYPKAVANSRLVGSMVAQFIWFLNKQTGNTPDSFHVIGFSLGAQVSGYAGKRFHDLTDKKIGRITGLDPAAPGYKDEHVDVRLDGTDAAFVDVIHSDAPRIGTPDKSGKFDFWPNGGKRQPGCLIKRKKRGVIFNLFSCEHYRAHQYFIESIKSTNCKFVSRRCSSYTDFTRGKCVPCGSDGKACPEMGYNAIKYKDLDNGDFYLDTNKKPPYCIPRYMYVTFVTLNKGWYPSGRNPVIRITGSRGKTGDIKLHGTLKKGTTVRFLVPIKKSIGKPKAIQVANYSFFFRWKLGKVTVQYTDEESTYSACFNVGVGRSYKKRKLVSGNTQCKREDFVDTPRKDMRIKNSKGARRKNVRSKLALNQFE